MRHGRTNVIVAAMSLTCIAVTAAAFSFGSHMIRASVSIASTVRDKVTIAAVRAEGAPVAWGANSAKFGSHPFIADRALQHPEIVRLMSANRL